MPLASFRHLTALKNGNFHFWDSYSKSSCVPIFRFFTVFISLSFIYTFHRLAFGALLIPLLEGTGAKSQIVLSLCWLSVVMMLICCVIGCQGRSVKKFHRLEI